MSRHPLTRHLAAALTGLVSVAVAAPAAPAFAADTLPTGTLVSDTFDRAVTGSWGAAPGTGNWTLTANAGASTAGGRALTPTMAPGSSFRASSVQNAGTDVTVRGGLVVPTGLNASFGLEARRQSNGSTYRATVYLHPNGTPYLSITRLLGGAETSLQTVALPFTVSAGQILDMEFEATGTAPVSGRARAWVRGTTVPSWQVSGTDPTSQRITTSGVTGVSVLNGGTTSRQFMVEDFTATNRSASTSTPTPTPTVTPTPTSTTGTTTTTSGTVRTGAPTVGTSSYPVPAGAVFVAPTGSDTAAGTAAAPVRTVNRAVALAPAGGTIVLRGGTYREEVYIPAEKPVTVQPYPGEAVWFDGSRPVTGFTATGSTWSVGGWTLNLDSSPTFTRGAADGTAPGWQFVNPAYPMAAHPDQVWIDGVEQREVKDLASVVPGTFYVDTAAQRLHLGTNPTGHTVEAGTLVRAFRILGQNTVVRGVGIRRYNPSVPDNGAITVYGSGTTIENVRLQDSATIGVGIARAGVTVRNTTIDGSGMLGVSAYQADNLMLDNVVVTNNNDEHFNYAPVSGGIKTSSTRGVTVRNSVVSKNDGPGIWLDESTYDSTVSGNDISGNAARGIFLEISAKAAVTDNVIKNNGLYGITVRNTDGVLIQRNTILATQRAIDLSQDSRLASNTSLAGHDTRRPLPDPGMTWLLGNVTILDNTLSTTSGDAILGVEDWTLARDADAMAIKADRNTYRRTSTTSPKWTTVWARKGTNPWVYTSLTAFRTARGQEASGSEVIGALAGGTKPGKGPKKPVKKVVKKKTTKKVVKKKPVKKVAKKTTRKISITKKSTKKRTLKVARSTAVRGRR